MIRIERAYGIERRYAWRLIRRSLVLTLALIFCAQAGSGDRDPLTPDPAGARDASVSGRNVELDKAAMNAFSFADEANGTGSPFPRKR